MRQLFEEKNALRAAGNTKEVWTSPGRDPYMKGDAGDSGWSRAGTPSTDQARVRPSGGTLQSRKGYLWHRLRQSLKRWGGAPDYEDPERPSRQSGTFGELYGLRKPVYGPGILARRGVHFIDVPPIYGRKPAISRATWVAQMPFCQSKALCA